MKLSFSANKYFYLLLLLFAISELIVMPTGNFPLNDDWTYAKSVRELFLYNNLKLGPSNCTLWTQLQWGLLFVKAFGFSFVVLRCSTLVLSVIGLWYLYKLVLRISNKPLLAFISCLALLYCPLYFNLSNTFMTDVDFNALLICCCYVTYTFFDNKNPFCFVMIFVLSVLLVLLRQFGIIFPFCATLACLFLKEKRWHYTLAGLGLSIVVFGIFKYFEYYITTLEDSQLYTQSGGFSLSSADFWARIYGSFKFKFPIIIVYAAVFTLPVSLVYLRPLIKQLRPYYAIVFGIVSLVITYWFFAAATFPLGNIFVNMGLGSETFHERLNEKVRANVEHTHNELFGEIMTYVKNISVFLFLVVVFCAITVMVQKQRAAKALSPKVVYLSLLIGLYAFLLLISDAIFDRYTLPVITLVILAMAEFAGHIELRTRIAWLALIPMMYVSVAGTKDYFGLNTKRWEAYNYLRFQEGVKNNRINAGYEVDAWNDGWYGAFYESLILDHKDYLIQYRKEPGFKVYREFEFQRYFPYKKDKIFIFVREQN